MSKTKNTGSDRKAPDAIALLKADHRQVKQWFDDFENARSAKKKQALAASLCKALTVHCRIEEEILYPAFLRATRDKDMHHEAVIEHESAKKLIGEIEASGASDEYFDARVHVLAEMIEHHVREEEKPEGMFAHARRSRKMDLHALGRTMLERKTQLMGEG